MTTIYTSDVFVSGRIIYRTPEMVLREIMRPDKGVLIEAGFQKVETCGDLQETHNENEPDCIIHIADKSYQDQ